MLESDKRFTKGTSKHCTYELYGHRSLLNIKKWKNSSRTQNLVNEGKGRGLNVRKNNTYNLDSSVVKITDVSHK